MKIEPVEEINARVKAPPSKSYTHRAFFAGYIAGGVEVLNPLRCDDTLATVESLRTLGAEISWEGIRGVHPHAGDVNAGESGTTARFAMGIASLIDGWSRIDGACALRRRPMAPLIKALRDAGARIESHGTLPVAVRGPLRAKEFRVDGSVSSQFVSSLLLVAASTEGCVEYSSLVSRGYVDMTVRTLQWLGAEIKVEDGHICVERAPRGGRIRIPGDYSSAAFFLVAGALFGKVRVENLLRSDVQPDMEILSILSEFGARVRTGDNCVEVEQHELHAVDVDCTHHPDLFPILAVLAAYSPGTSLLRGRQLRYKESDRIRSMAVELRKMGVRVEEKKDALVIHGGELRGTVLDSHNDHRIAMALGIAALGARGSSRIRGWECVSKSYPEFFQDLRRVVQ